MPDFIDLDHIDRLLAEATGPTHSETPITREQAIAHLRSLPAEGLLEFLREARVCREWREDDNERGEGPYRYLACIGDVHLAAVHCDPDGDAPYGTPDLDGERAAEDAAIAAGYRVPWRTT